MVTGMDTDRGFLGKDAELAAKSKVSHRGVIENKFGTRKNIVDNYTQLTLDFGKFNLLVRVYNEAAAYRFVSKFDGQMVVNNELLELSSVADSDKTIAHVVRGDKTSFERVFRRQNADALKKQHSASLPFFFEKSGMKVAVAESAWFDYAGMRISYPADAKSPKAYFVKCPKKLGFSYKGKVGGSEYDGMYVVKETENYIAKTCGSRAFPWRGFIVARKDIDLADNDTVYKLAEPSRIGDASWVKPGTCAWEWWSACQLEGVDFKGGVNNETYRYYIDFAAENKIPYVLLDAGWLTGEDVGGMDDKIDEAMISGKTFVDVPGLIAYAHSKDVKVLLWCLGQSMDKYGERAFEIMKSWGADGVKIDFIDRDDQQAQGFYERMARIAAQHEMVVDFHGCAKPAGLQRTYPNVVNFEAVRGCEFNKFSAGLEPSHNIDLVFTRMLQGPMDYTPGALRNVSQNGFTKSFKFPQMKGTRSQMVAQYVLYYAPVQMLCDSASEYKKYPDILHFIANAPTSWDDTKALEGRIGEYVVVARRKGDVWYIGGMNDWNARTVTVDLSKFLPEDSEYKVEIIRDSKNSDNLPCDYKREIKEVNSDSVLKIDMSKGGGFAMKLTPKRIPIIDDIIRFFTE